MAHRSRIADQVPVGPSSQPAQPAQSAPIASIASISLPQHTLHYKPSNFLGPPHLDAVFAHSLSSCPSRIPYPCCRRCRLFAHRARVGFSPEPHSRFEAPSSSSITLPISRPPIHPSTLCAHRPWGLRNVPPSSSLIPYPSPYSGLLSCCQVQLKLQKQAFCIFAANHLLNCLTITALPLFLRFFFLLSSPTISVAILDERAWALLAAKPSRSWKVYHIPTNRLSRNHNIQHPIVQTTQPGKQNHRKNSFFSLSFVFT